MNLQIVFYTLGILLLTLGVALLIPFLVDLASSHENAGAFGWSAVVALFAGGGLCISNQGFTGKLALRQAFVLTLSGWLCVALFAALPLYFSDLELSLTNAFFESISGVTTTGATILTQADIDNSSEGILLWRALMQWIGGVGVIAYTMILLPILRVGGMQIFHLETAGSSEKATPRAREAALRIVEVYLGISVLCIFVYYALGMSGFDAIAHAMTSVSTGGFSTHGNSFAYFEGYALHIAAALFMLAGGLPFILYLNFIYQGKFQFFSDYQVKTYAFIFLLIVVVLTTHLSYTGQYGVLEAFRLAFFNVASILSTTGYVSTDYALWGPFAVAIFFFLIYCGACAGSTSGGLKMLRINIAFKALNRHLKTLIYPSGVFSAVYQGRPLKSDIINAVMGFLFLYVACNVVLTIALSLTGLDFMTSISGAGAAMANVGPGMGDVIGPGGNYASLNAPAKWFLCAGMILGRLELMSVLVLLSPSFWRE